MDKNPNFDLNFGRFKNISKEKKEEIIRNSKAANTNKATDLWMNCFSDYLAEKELPKVQDIATDELPTILSDFYVEVKKKDRKKPQQEGKKAKA